MPKSMYFFVFIFSLYLVCHLNLNVAADTSDYSTFPEINISTGRLLKNYLDSDFDEAFKKIAGKKFSGWKINTVCDKVETSFESDTVYSFYNSGEKEIKYELEKTNQKVVKTSISATGTIKYSLSGTTKTKFKNGLDASLKLEAKYEETVTVKGEETLNVSIEGNTMCIIYYTGTALVTNGVAKRYSFWLLYDYGGFEFFTIQNMYQRIEKRTIC